MAEPVRHRQTKGAATDMFNLQPPRHISTLRISPIAPEPRRRFLDRTDTGRSALVAGSAQLGGELSFGPVAILSHTCSHVLLEAIKKRRYPTVIATSLPNGWVATR